MVPIYAIPDAHLDVIFKALKAQPWEVVNTTIQMLLTQANSPENVALRNPNSQEKQNGN